MIATFTLDPVARWESKSGKWWAELYGDGVHYWYRGEGCGGNLGRIDEAVALSTIQEKVDSGYFQPDALKTPMKRIK